MDHTFWQKQPNDKPLFPELEWSRPENRQHAGKLLIVGGNGYEFKAPANAYGDALDAGIGTATVLLPSSMQKVVSDIFPEAEFAPSTPSGSFARTALEQLAQLSNWADSVLLAGDTGRNSETSVMFETFLRQYQGQVTITRDTANVLIQQPLQILQRKATLLVLAMGQLRELGGAAKFPHAFTSDLGVVRLVELLHEFTSQHAVHIITRHQNQFLVAVNGQVSTTPDGSEQKNWRVGTASHAAVWWLQNPGQPFEALTTAVRHSSR